MRFVTRACPVCEWTHAAFEPSSKDPAASECRVCHAPMRIVREQLLVDATELRDQAAAFGRAGGLKGGRIRAEKLSPRRRSEIARLAAAARWKRR